MFVVVCMSAKNYPYVPLNHQMNIVETWASTLFIMTKLS